MISKEDRKVAKIQTIPLHLQNAFIAIEDRKFREHYGIDPIRILGSIFVNLKSGRAAQGGSTITQQLARNAFLSQEKTFARKIKEVLITLGLERRYTKDELMEKYFVHDYADVQTSQIGDNTKIWQYCVVLSGSMAEFVDYTKVTEAVNKEIVTTPTKVVPAKYANNSGLIGAALFALDAKSD